MWFLSLLSWISLLLQICFATLSIATCLYYLAELVEEYSVTAGRIIHWTICVVILIHIAVLVFENLPAYLSGCGIAGLVTTLAVMRTFPYCELTSPSFIITCILLVVNHYLAFQYFSEVYHPFHEVIAYFTICQWLVPLQLLVSLSANENVLPTVSERTRLISSNDDDVLSNYFSRKGKKYGLLSLFNYARESVLPVRNKKAY